MIHPITRTVFTITAVGIYMVYFTTDSTRLKERIKTINFLLEGLDKKTSQRRNINESLHFSSLQRI